MNTRNKHHEDLKNAFWKAYAGFEVDEATNCEDLIGLIDHVKRLMQIYANARIKLYELPG